MKRLNKHHIRVRYAKDVGITRPRISENCDEQSFMEKIDNNQEQMGNESKDMETLRKNQNEMLKNIKNTVTEIKNNFDGLIRRLNMDEETFLSLRI